MINHESEYDHIDVLAQGELSDYNLSHPLTCVCDLRVMMHRSYLSQAMSLDCIANLHT